MFFSHETGEQIADADGITDEVGFTIYDHEQHRFIQLKSYDNMTHETYSFEGFGRPINKDDSKTDGIKTIEEELFGKVELKDIKSSV